MPRGDGTGPTGQYPGTSRNRGLSRGQDRGRMDEQEEEILSEITELMNGKKDPASVQDKGILSAKLKNLVALGVAIASQQEPEVINVCVENCLKSGATKQNVMAVQQKAILMAQMPVETYTKTVKNAILETKTMSGLITEVDSHEFEKVISEGITLVDFWAPWCGPCKMQGLVLDAVAKKIGSKAKIVKANVDEVSDAADKLGIKAIPTLVLFKDGQEMQRFIGLQSEGTLVDAVVSLSSF
jgi:thioredoxin 1